MVPMYTYFITEPIINMYNRFRHCGLHIWVGSDYGLESRQPCALWVLESLKADNNRYEVMPSPAASDGTEERRRRPEKVGRVKYRFH